MNWWIHEKIVFSWLMKVNQHQFNFSWAMIFKVQATERYCSVKITVKYEKFVSSCLNANYIYNFSRAKTYQVTPKMLF